MSRTIALLLLAALPGSALAASYHIDLKYDPPAQSAAAETATFVVQVSDEREFVKSGNKTPAYLGHYRSIAAVVWDVANHDDVPLADQFRTDLARDLQAMGFRPGDPGSAKTLKVVIHDWNFNTYTDGELSFDIDAEIDAPDGHALATTHVQDRREIKGSVWTGPIGPMKKEVPVIYGEIVRKLVREDAGMMAALRAN